MKTSTDNHNSNGNGNTNSSTNGNTTNNTNGSGSGNGDNHNDTDINSTRPSLPYTHSPPYSPHRQNYNTQNNQNNPNNYDNNGNRIDPRTEGSGSVMRINERKSISPPWNNLTIKIDNSHRNDIVGVGVGVGVGGGGVGVGGGVGGDTSHVVKGIEGKDRDRGLEREKSQRTMEDGWTDNVPGFLNSITNKILGTEQNDDENGEENDEEDEDDEDEAGTGTGTYLKIQLYIICVH